MEFIARDVSGYTDFTLKLAHNDDFDTILFEKTFTIGVNVTPVSSLEFNEKKVIRKLNNTYDLGLTILPEDSFIREAEISCSDPDAFAFDGNKITPLKEGLFDIVARIEDGPNTFIDTCQVDSRFEPLLSIHAPAETVEIQRGFATEISFTYVPEDTSVRSYALESADPTSVEIVDGKLVGKTIGAEVLITAKAGDVSTTFTAKVTGVDPSSKVQMQETHYGWGQTYPYYWNTPSRAKQKMLVLPIWFPDSNEFIAESKRDNVLEDIATVFMGETSDTGWHSVKSFYEEESGGALTLDFEIAPWQDAPLSYADYGGRSSSREATERLIQNAAESYLTSAGKTHADFDADGDGFFDGICAVVAAPNYNDLMRAGVIESVSGYDNLWAYCSDLYYPKPQKANVENPSISNYFWGCYDFMYTKALAASRLGDDTYYYAYSSYKAYPDFDSHIYTHEVGHMFGLPDYYDYSNQYAPTLRCSMQDNNTLTHDPFSKLTLGWADAYIPENDCTITLNDINSGHEVIILTPEWNAYDSPFDEYLVLEVFSGKGMHAYDVAYGYQGTKIASNDFGIRLWHCDGRILARDDEYSLYPRVGYTDYEYGGAFLPKFAFSNTYYSATRKGSELGEEYSDYNILQLISASNRDTLHAARGTTLEAADLFTAGDSFSMEEYASQFVIPGKLNKNIDLGWSFRIDALDASRGNAIITLAKTA